MTIQVSMEKREVALALGQGFSELLDDLLDGHVYRCGELPAPPPKAGVYLLAEPDTNKVVHVGRARNLQARRRNHTTPKSPATSATFAVKIAIENARTANPDLPLKRTELLLHDDFEEHFWSAKQYVRGLDFRCVELEDPPRQAIFEIVASMATGLPRELWQTH